MLKVGKWDFMGNTVYVYDGENDEDYYSMDVDSMQEVPNYLLEAVGTYIGPFEDYDL